MSMPGQPPTGHHQPPRPAIVAAEMGARAARAWASSIPATDSQGEFERTLPPSAWCTRPPTPEEQRAAAERRAARDREPQPDPVERELSQYASHLVGTAWFSSHTQRPQYGAVPDAMPDLSAEALEAAHGCRIGRVRVWKYFSNRAYVCLDCHWVGEFVSAQHGAPEPDAKAAAAHLCRGRQV